jgi:hypothetical protein
MPIAGESMIAPAMIIAIQPSALFMATPDSNPHAR